MVGTGVNILVNDFMFCAAHGSEFCLVCFCDHRMCNNIRVEDGLSNMSKLFLDLDFDIEERRPFNAYRLGAIFKPSAVKVAISVVHTEDSYQCEIHKAIDCNKCFDWVKFIKQEAGVEEK